MHKDTSFKNGDHCLARELIKLSVNMTDLVVNNPIDVSEETIMRAIDDFEYYVTRGIYTQSILATKLDAPEDAYYINNRIYLN